MCCVSFGFGVGTSAVSKSSRNTSMGKRVHLSFREKECSRNNIIPLSAIEMHMCNYDESVKWNAEAVL